MGIIDICKYGWDSKCGGWGVVGNGLTATHTFLDNLRFKRANKPFKCGVCKNEKPKNTRYLGEQYVKICSGCSTEWFKNSIAEMQKIINKISDSKENLENNKEKWKKEMILGALS